MSWQVGKHSHKKKIHKRKKSKTWNKLVDQVSPHFNVVEKRLLQLLATSLFFSGKLRLSPAA